MASVGFQLLREKNINTVMSFKIYQTLYNVELHNFNPRPIPSAQKSQLMDYPCSL